MSVKVYLDEDADLLDLQNKVCVVIGFGSQGHAHALNLRNSGIPSSSFTQAQHTG
jgi:ketol-acid reductoisomerase